MTNAAEFLVHYGVKGMKWGYTKYSSEDIKTSRAHVKAKKKELKSGDKYLKSAIKAGDTTKAKALLKKQVAESKKLNMSEEQRAAFQTTTGEKIVNALAGNTYGNVMDNISRSDKDWASYTKSSEKLINKYESKKLKAISKVEAKKS